MWAGPLQAAIVVLVAAAAAVWFAFFAGSGNEAPAAPGSSVGATTGDGSTSSGAEQSGTWTGQRELPCRPHGACVR